MHECNITVQYFLKLTVSVSGREFHVGKICVRYRCLENGPDAGLETAVQGLYSRPRAQVFLIRKTGEWFFFLYSIALKATFVPNFNLSCSVQSNLTNSWVWHFICLILWIYIYVVLRCNKKLEKFPRLESILLGKRFIFPLIFAAHCSVCFSLDDLLQVRIGWS